MYVAERVVVVVVLVGIPAYAIFLANPHACMDQASGVVWASACADAISGLKAAGQGRGIRIDVAHQIGVPGVMQAGCAAIDFYILSIAAGI